MELAARGEVVDTLYGVKVADPYRWMEDATSEATASWTSQREADYRSYTGALPQQAWLAQRLEQLWRYDDERPPQPCLLANKEVVMTKQADQDKWVVHLRQTGEEGPGRVVLDPNTWGATESLGTFTPSPDCHYAAFGRAQGGDENPVLRIIDLESLEVLPDTFSGWRQGEVAWLHDDSGLYFSGRPVEGSVAPGDEQYFHRAWFHTFGTTMDQDVVVLADDKVKERWHEVQVSEDGQWLLWWQGIFNKGRLWLSPVDAPDKRQPLMAEMDWEYAATVVDDRIFIQTDWEAPNGRVLVTSVDEPQREHWTEFLPESDDKLAHFDAIDGALYATYEHKATTRIEVLSPQGEKLHDLALPTVGSAQVSGYWSKGPVWLSFNSFHQPSTVYRYDASQDQLTEAWRSPIDMQLDGVIVEQVRYPSKDGTEITMFLVRREDAPQDGSLPVLLTGYGGFNISLTPRFSTTRALWIEAGGAVAVPNLRGGGEYGREWHEAGMRERKQNVFDNFIAAADWLVDNKWTSRDRLAIAGGSNGGLLVSATITQRPDLCAAVLCAVPLTDMVRYHKLGLANIWAEEYGSTDEEAMLKPILAYSPYHNVIEGTDYPAILITGSANDARTDPAHARKFAAAVRWADADHGTEEPILLTIHSDSGHLGAVELDTQIDQYSREYAFLMEQVGLTAPATE